MDNQSATKETPTISEGEILAEELTTELAPEPTPEQQLVSLEKQLAETKDNWLRALADNENLRRRSQKEREDALKYGATSLGREIVVVVDNLQRALDSCPPSDDLPSSVQALIQGVEMTAKEVLTIFEKHGIKRISPLGEKFDPNFHQAVFEVETDDHPAGHVAQVLQEGYVMHDRLLRAAMVGVAKTVLLKDS